VSVTFVCVGNGFGLSILSVVPSSVVVMSITTGPGAVALPALVGRLRDVLSGVVDADLVRVSSRELLLLVGEVVAAQAQLAAVRLALVGEVEVRGLALEAGASSTAGWLRGSLRVGPQEARRTVAVAAALAQRYPVTAQALAGGGVSLAQVEVICRTLDQLPDRVDAATVAAAEQQLLDLAAEHDPGALAKLGEHLRYVLDPDRERDLAALEADLAETAQVHLTRRDGSGVWDLRGRLDPQTGHALATALDALSKPRPSGEHGRDGRTAGQRRADALAALVDLAMSHQHMPSVDGARPTIIVTIPYATLRAPAHQGGLGGGSWPDGSLISAGTARRLACQARILPAVLGGASQPLDLGRAAYAVPTHLRRAVHLRQERPLRHPRLREHPPPRPPHPTLGPRRNHRPGQPRTFVT
jgi:hypothetical protein